jgi:hypothetical protein
MSRPYIYLRFSWLNVLPRLQYGTAAGHDAFAKRPSRGFADGLLSKYKVPTPEPK